jgi:FkbM family methyltransferase
MPDGSYLDIPRKVFLRVLRAYRKRILRNYVDEVDLLFKGFFKTANPGVMFDVGAHHGSSLRSFAKAHWHIEAFEPDRKNFETLKQKTLNYPKVRLHRFAVGAENHDSVDFYESSESSGVSGLSAFLKSHVKAEPVRLVNLASFIRENDAPTPDFLKIDTEGHDLFVLQGYPWTSKSPRIILCEFENSKTEKLGYTAKQLSDFLNDRNYLIIISEWNPITRYGGEHRWNGFFRDWRTSQETATWGNMIAFRDQEDYSNAVAWWPISDEKNQ